MKTRKPAQLRVEHLMAGRRELTVIYKRRWAMRVMGVVRGVDVSIFRNGVTTCEDHGQGINCSHINQFTKTCEEYGIWL